MTFNGLVVGGPAAGERHSHHDTRWEIQVADMPPAVFDLSKAMDAALCTVTRQQYVWRELSVKDEYGNIGRFGMWVFERTSLAENIAALFEGYLKPRPKDCNHSSWFGEEKCPACGSDSP